jgi:peroxiredoxin
MKTKVPAAPMSAAMTTSVVARCRMAAGRRYHFASPKDDPQETSAMAIKVGDRLPDGKLMESTEFDSATQCAMAPKEVNVADAAKGKKIAIFGLPGAYTPTCSAKHVPSYVQNMDQLKKKGVNEIWCVATNDAFVMAHWGRDQKALGKIRFLGDGSAQWTKALGLELDLNPRGMGTRMQRFSMLVDNGVVKQLNVEQPGKFEVSDAATMLKQL